MSKKINYQVLHKHSSYSTAELASLLKVTRHAIHYWVHHLGLKPLNPTEHVWIFSGETVIIFLKEKRIRFKKKINDDEIYCLSCRIGKRVTVESIKLEYTGKKVGINDAEQIIIHGLCVTCGHKCRRFSSSNRRDEFLSHYPGYSK